MNFLIGFLPFVVFILLERFVGAQTALQLAALMALGLVVNPSLLRQNRRFNFFGSLLATAAAAVFTFWRGGQAGQSATI